MDAGEEVRRLGTQEITPYTDTRDILAHAGVRAAESGLKDYFIVDMDAHHVENSSWPEIMRYIEDPVLRHNGSWLAEERGVLAFSNYSPGLNAFQDVSGRIPHNTKLGESVPPGPVHRDITLVRRAMDSIGANYQVIFPTPMLQLGLHPDPAVETQLAFAYNRWFVENILAEEPRIKALLYLPFGDPEASLRVVREFAGRPGVIGFMVTSQRQRAVHDNAYMPLYAELERRGLPLGFHASLNWESDQWMRTTNRFLSLHAISFTHCNIVHLTNWIVGGIPERFPDLKVIWIESGLAWVPFLMQRLDHLYMMRQSDAPLLRRPPSEYMREMYYTSQPMETTNMRLLETTFEAMNAETQLLYSSDWPHWDWDPPSTIYDLPFLSDEGKRNILGETARKLFDL